MTTARPARLLAIAGLALLLGACASIEKSERREGLTNALKNYERALRWGMFDDAWSMHRQEDGQPRLAPERLAGLKVTRYQVIAVQPGEDDRTFRQSVRIEYYLDDSPRVRRITQQQHWEYDDTSRRWWLVSPPPAF